MLGHNTANGQCLLFEADGTSCKCMLVALSLSKAYPSVLPFLFRQAVVFGNYFHLCEEIENSYLHGTKQIVITLYMQHICLLYYIISESDLKYFLEGCVKMNIFTFWSLILTTGIRPYFVNTCYSRKRDNEQ